MKHADIVINKSIREQKGHSARVVFGDHKISGAEVAIKWLETAKAEDAERFRQENEILFELIKNDNVITPYSKILTAPNGKMLYIMERADKTLIHWLDDFLKDEDFAEKISMLIKICSAITSIQAEGYIHRDLHEKNVLVSLVKDKYIPKLVDFGRSFRSQKAIEISDDNSPSWGYFVMPPEFEFGLVSRDDPSHMLGDSYSVGLMVKTVLSPETAYNIGKLVEMKERIKDFQIKKVAGSTELYKDRSLRLREADYLEWCEKNKAWSEGWLSLRLSSQVRTDKVTDLIRKFSNINYLERESDLNVAISIMKGL
ncbi:MAG TPA: protein kinase [Candidatus Microsaccharimonas sp.]